MWYTHHIPKAVPFLGIAVCALFVFFCYQQSMTIESQQSVINQLKNELTHVDSQSTQPPSVVDQYMQSGFRVLAAASSPKGMHTVVVATERDGTNDDASCGSIYSSPNCYFFLEAGIYSTDAMKKTFLAMYGGKHLSGLVPSSVTFIDENTVEFITEGGDGPCSEKHWIRLDIVSRKFSMYKDESRCFQE